MATPDIIALVASAGGLHGISHILEALPTSLPASVIVLQHISGRSMLVDILARRSALPVRWIEDGAPLERGCVHVAPGQCEVRIATDERFVALAPMRTSRNPGDALLESLADLGGERVLAVVLTGTGSDGALGAMQVRTQGGTVFAQDPDTAEYREMPQFTIASGAADVVLPLADLATAITRTVAGSRCNTRTPPIGRGLHSRLAIVGAPVAALLAGNHGPLTDAQRRALELVQRGHAELREYADRRRWLERFQSGVVRVDAAPIDVASITHDVVDRFRPIAANRRRALILDCVRAPHRAGRPDRVGVGRRRLARGSRSRAPIPPRSMWSSAWSASTSR